MMYQFLPVDRIHFGINIVEEQLVNEIRRSNGSRVLIVTTNSLLKTTAYNKILHALRTNKIEYLVTLSKQHVPGEFLMEDIKEIKDFKPDVIVSCGGGSPIDAGKILSLILSEDIETEEDLYLYSENLGKKRPKMENAIPNFSIPTTLSASEFTSIAGTTNKQDYVKYKFHHLHMTPKLVFLDPTFTEDTPEWLWLSTGMRAVDHAVETLYTPIPNPINTSLALEALKKLYTYLPLTKKHPENLEYRLECQLGAWLSLFSVDNIKLGLSHSIGHQLGAMYNIPHGMTSAIMLPAVMKFLLPRTYEEQAKITDVLGIRNPIHSTEENAKLAPELIKNLVKTLRIPHRLRDFDVSIESVPTLIENILYDIRSEGNEFVIGTRNLENEIKNLVESVW